MAAANLPTVEELIALIQTLQNQVATLKAAQANATTATTTNVNPTPVVFTDTPGTLGVDDIIDYKTKQGTVTRLEALQRKCTVMGWNSGTKQITSFTNKDGKTVDIIKQYGQIDEARLKTQCENFCKPGEPNAQTRAKQNNTMMCICLSKSLTSAAQAKLLAHQSEFTFDDVEYAPLKYKIIMRLTTMDSVATTQSLRENLQNLATFAATVQGDIDKYMKNSIRITHKLLHAVQLSMTPSRFFSTHTTQFPATTSRNTLSSRKTSTSMASL